MRLPLHRQWSKIECIKKKNKQNIPILCKPDGTCASPQCWSINKLRALLLTALLVGLCRSAKCTSHLMHRDNYKWGRSKHRTALDLRKAWSRLAFQATLYSKCNEGFFLLFPELNSDSCYLSTHLQMAYAWSLRFLNWPEPLIINIKSSLTNYLLEHSR